MKKITKGLKKMLEKEIVFWYGTNVVHRSWTIPEIIKWKIGE
jgi:hypothetical protein